MTLVPWIALTVTGCSSSQVERDVDQKASEHPGSTSTAEASEHQRSMIEADTTLSRGQKDRLLSLQSKMAAESLRIKSESNRLMALMLEDLIASKSKNSDEEIKEIQKQLISLSNERIDLMTQGLKDAQKIIGRPASKTDVTLYREFMREPRLRSDFSVN